MSMARICSRNIVSLHGDESLQQAARLMREHHVGTVVVTQPGATGTQVAGLVTDRDLAIEVLARGGDAGELTVGALVGGQVLLSVPESAEPGEAIAIMQSGGVRRLLVGDEEGHLVGIVSFDDLLRFCAAQIAGLGAVLGKEMEREMSATPRLPPLPPAGEPAPPPRPALRVPAMGTAGWPMRTGLPR